MTTKLVSKSNPKSIITNAVWNLILTFWQVAVGFFLAPFLISHLGIEDYGLFILIMSISGLLGVLDLGLSQAAVRFVSFYFGKQDLGGINRVIGSSFAIYLLVGFIGWASIFFGARAIVPLFAISPNDTELGESLLRMMAFSFGLGFVGAAFASIPESLQRYDIRTKILLFQNFFQLTGTILIIFSGKGLKELVLWGVITAFITQVIYMIVAKQLIPELKLYPYPTKAGMKEVFSFGIFVIIMQIFSIIWQETDRLLLGMFVSASSVAFLTVPKNLAFRGSDTVANLGSVLFPKFSMTSDSKKNSRLYLDATWTTLFTTIVIFVPLTVLFPDFIRLWISQDFAKESALVSQVLAFTCIIRGAFVPYDPLFKGIGKPQYLSLVYVSAGITNFVFGLLLISKWGLKGAGYSYVIASIWGFLAIAVAWTKGLGNHSLAPLVRTVLIPIIMAMLLLLLTFSIRSEIQEPGWLGFIILAASFAGITAISIFGVEWILGKNESHAKSLILAIFHFLKIKKFYGDIS